MAMVARALTNTPPNALMAVHFTPRVAQVLIVWKIQMAAYIVASEQEEDRRNRMKIQSKSNQIKTELLNRKTWNMQLSKQLKIFGEFVKINGW